MTPELIAVVVNWNSRDDLLACLNALARSQPAAPPVVVVDNASSDGSAAMVRGTFPQVDLIQNARNLHFARAANQGLRRALTRGARFVLLLNPDALVAPGAVAEMLRVAQTDERVGVVGARLRHTRPRGAPWVVVGACCRLATGAIIEPPPPDDPALDRLEVDYVWGCALLARAAMLRQVGVFDESLIAYFEDADLCLRAAARGWRTVTALRAEVAHGGSRAANRVFAQQMWLRGRNWLRCYWRHASPRQRPLLLACMLGWRLPHLAWSALFTWVVRTARPRGRPLSLWG